MKHNLILRSTRNRSDPIGAAAYFSVYCYRQQSHPGADQRRNHGPTIHQYAHRISPQAGSRADSDVCGLYRANCGFNDS